MNKTELLLASRLLSLAAEEYSNHGCNDLDASLSKGLDKNDLKAIAHDISARDENEFVAFNRLADFELMHHFAYKLLEAAANA